MLITPRLALVLAAATLLVFLAGQQLRPKMSVSSLLTAAHSEVAPFQRVLDLRQKSLVIHCFKSGQLHFFTASNSTLKFVSCAKVWNPDAIEVYSPKEFESEEDEGGVGLHDTLCGQSLEQVLFYFACSCLG